MVISNNCIIFVHVKFKQKIMKNYIVCVSEYDTDGISVPLPKELEIEVPDNMTDVEEIEDFISDEISSMTGYCHKGFSYEVK